jgi:hypothetical protein
VSVPAPASPSPSNALISTGTPRTFDRESFSYAHSSP